MGIEGGYQDFHPEHVFKTELFFELSMDLFCIAGYDGYFRRINPAVCHVLGYTKEELFSRPISTFIHPDDQHITAKNRENLINSQPLLNFENRYLSKEGEVVWLSWTSMPVEEEQLVYAIAKNITYKKRMEEERNHLLSNLTKVNTDLKLLTYKISHDLKSPVNNQLTVFSLMDLSSIQDRETLEYIEILKMSTDALKETLQNYAQVLTETEDQRIQIEPLSLRDTLQGVQQSILSLIQDARATFDVDFSGNEMVVFNKLFLESIFLNLITNSIKYRRPECFPKITIRSGKAENGCQLIFTDNGLGFDLDKIRHRLFGLKERFHHHEDSSGIGLYLVYNHLVSLGGSIQIDSKINEGTTFTISFKSH